LHVKQHVKEEQKEMFAKARKAGLDLNDLGQQMLLRKQELIDELSGSEAAAVRPPPPRRAAELGTAVAMLFVKKVTVNLNFPRSFT
jgi:hypothetical protein